LKLPDLLFTTSRQHSIMETLDQSQACIPWSMLYFCTCPCCPFLFQKVSSHFFKTLAVDLRMQDLKPPEDPPHVDTGQQTLTLILNFSDQDPSNLSKVSVNLSPLDRNPKSILFLSLSPDLSPL
jgi:hypothetical protein